MPWWVTGSIERHDLAAGAGGERRHYGIRFVADELHGPVYRARDVLDKCADFQFWSLHSGGANFAFAYSGLPTSFVVTTDRNSIRPLCT